MTTITHRIQLLPNNKQKTYFRKAIGCARLAYNWGLDYWEQQYKAGVTNMDDIKVRNAFNAIRREQFPFTYEVTKYATAHAFTDLYAAYKNFFAKRANYPKYRRKRDGYGSFYLGADQIYLSETNRRLKFLKNKPHNLQGKHQYLNLPNLGFVKMSEHLRFNGKIFGVCISQEGEKFFASLWMKISDEEYLRTHPNTIIERVERSVGIDLGMKAIMTLSDGISVENPHTLIKHQRKIVKLNRQLRKRFHARTKQQRLQGVKRSKNFIKAKVPLNKEYRHVKNIRHDFMTKLSSIITTHYSHIVLEGLDLGSMPIKKNNGFGLIDASMGLMKLYVTRMAAMNGCKITIAERTFPSSKICHACGFKNDALKLADRIYNCPQCGMVIDRDYNASLNLLGLITNRIGAVRPESTPADLTALQSRFDLNGIATSKVETGRQHWAV